MREEEILVECKQVGKRFCRDLKRSLWYGILNCIRELMPFAQGEITQLRKFEFWANKDINFTVARGECLGIIGKNGSGKTTILKIVNGLIKPDQGTVKIRGRVGALIALGAGFNPVLTGRENIYINGAILGISKERINNLIPEIIEFSELEEFIDTPVQNYSSGMKIRLGFAIAINIKPDVLIIDEVLAVGDQRFRRKAKEAIQRLLDRDIAVVFVSHNIHEVMGMTSKVLWLDEGKMRMYGPTVDVCAQYTREMLGAVESKESYIQLTRQTGEAVVLGSNCSIGGTKHGRKIIVSQEDAQTTKLKCEVKLLSKIDFEGPLYYILHLKNSSDEFVGSVQFTHHTEIVKDQSWSFSFEFDASDLHLGEYLIELEIGTVGGPLLVAVKNLHYLEIEPPQLQSGSYAFAYEKMRNNDRGSYLLPVSVLSIDDRSV